MKQDALGLALRTDDPIERTNILRDYIQACALRSLHESRAFEQLSFVGVRHHDLPSMMAGKIHAILSRPYAKGRDWYDLLWYLSRRPPVEPNATLLEAALLQTGAIPREGWQSAIVQRIMELDFRLIRADIEPFLEHREEAALLDRASLLALVRGT